MRTDGVLNIFGKLLIPLSLFLLTPDFWVMARKPVWRCKFQEGEGSNVG
jgi:hypothetical protein